MTIRIDHESFELIEAARQELQQRSEQHVTMGAAVRELLVGLALHPAGVIGAFKAAARGMDRATAGRHREHAKRLRRQRLLTESPTIAGAAQTIVQPPSTTSV